MGGGLSKKQRDGDDGATAAQGGARRVAPQLAASSRPPPYSLAASNGPPPPVNPFATAAGADDDMGRSSTTGGGMWRMPSMPNMGRQPSIGRLPSPPNAPPPPYPGLELQGGDEEDEEELFSDLPPTMISLSLDKATELPPQGPVEAGGVGVLYLGVYYCVVVIGCVTRVFASVAGGVDEATFYCSSIAFPLHQRKVRRHNPHNLQRSPVRGRQREGKRLFPCPLCNADAGEEESEKDVKVDNCQHVQPTPCKYCLHPTAVGHA